MLQLSPDRPAQAKRDWRHIEEAISQISSVSLKRMVPITACRADGRPRLDATHALMFL